MGLKSQTVKAMSSNLISFQDEPRPEARLFQDKDTDVAPNTTELPSGNLSSLFSENPFVGLIRSIFLNLFIHLFSANSVNSTGVDDVCSQQKESGICKAIFFRFYFNHQTGKCEEFVYGGE